MKKNRKVLPYLVLGAVSVGFASCIRKKYLKKKQASIGHTK